MTLEKDSGLNDNEKATFWHWGEGSVLCSTYVKSRYSSTHSLISAQSRGDRRGGDRWEEGTGGDKGLVDQPV